MVNIEYKILLGLINNGLVLINMKFLEFLKFDHLYTFYSKKDNMR